MKNTASGILSLLLVLTMVLGCLPAAFAEETKTPAAIQNTYTVGDVTYYNVNSSRFDSPPHYLRDLMSTRSSELGGKSMAQLWMEVGAGMALSDYNLLDNASNPFNAGAKTALDTVISAIGGSSAQSGSFKAGASSPIYATSIERAATALRNSIAQFMFDMGSFYNHFYPYNSKNATEMAAAQKNQDVIAAVCYGYQDNCAVCVQVYFTDFQAVALLPDNSGTNYVTTVLKDNKKSDRTYASNVKNLTLSPVTASQNVFTSWTSSVTSTVSHSDSYSLSEAVKLGYETNFEVAKFTAELSISSTQAVTKGWSKATTESKSGTISETVSVSLPPYTNVLLEQGSSSTEAETKYNCPVGLKYKATVRTIAVWGSNESPLSRISYGTTAFGPDARADLYKRALRDGDMDIDSDMHWPIVLGYDGMRSRIAKLTSHVPMSSVGATFLETRDTTFTEVKSIVPTDPLARVKILPPDIGFVSSQQLSYNNLNYLHADMKVGESSYTNYLKLRGENTYGAEYYGFSYLYGHWIVVKPDGTEWTDDTAPVKVEKDPATGYIRYTAVKPGTCFLKYIIDEKSYTTANDLQAYTKNSDLASTAALEITVSGVKDDTQPTGTITISGNYFGSVGKDPEPLDKEDGLIVSIKDMTGKELDKPYHWEKQELDSRGIQLSADNKVSFTKTGKYHVRVVCDEIAAKSDWYEIEVHNYTFTAEGASIMASCTDPECDDVMFTVHAPQKTTYGDGKSAWASVTGQIPGMTPPVVSYKRGTETLSAPPRDAGVYTASITIENATASVEYTIEKAAVAILTLPVPSSIIAGHPLSESTLEGGKASAEGTFAWRNAEIRPDLSDSGTTSFDVVFTPTSGNYSVTICAVTLKVIPASASDTVAVAPTARKLSYTGEQQALVEPGEANEGTLVYALAASPEDDPYQLSYTEKVPTALEVGSYTVWYTVMDDEGQMNIQPSRLDVTIARAVPTIEFPVRELQATGSVQPLIVDPIVTPSQLVTVYYSLGDTENELTQPPVALEPGEYAVYYRIESNSPYCDSIPYGDPVIIEILNSLSEFLPDLSVSLEGWTYGEDANTPIVTGNEDMPVFFLYKKLDELDESYTEAVPADAGDYTVQAVVTSPNFYGEATASADFRIEKRVPVLDEDYTITPEIVNYNGTFQPLITVSVPEDSTLTVSCSFDRRNTLAGIPMKRDAGVYRIWYKVGGDPNYEELSTWFGPVTASILNPVTVVVNSTAKIFDGNPLQAALTLEGLPTGYSVQNAVFSGTITQPGEKEITVTSLTVVDPTGLDVTEICRLSFVPGKLTVLPQPDFQVPAMLREIGEEAFAGIGAKSILLGTSVKEVFPYAFSGCKALNSLIVLDADTVFHDCAFVGCESLVLYGPSDSEIFRFAEKNGISFVPLAAPGA